MGSPAAGLAAGLAATWAVMRHHSARALICDGSASSEGPQLSSMGPFSPAATVLHWMWGLPLSGHACASGAGARPPPSALSFHACHAALGLRPRILASTILPLDVGT